MIKRITLPQAGFFKGFRIDHLYVFLLSKTACLENALGAEQSVVTKPSSKWVHGVRPIQYDCQVRSDNDVKSRFDQNVVLSNCSHNWNVKNNGSTKYSK